MAIYANQYSLEAGNIFLILAMAGALHSAFVDIRPNYSIFLPTHSTSVLLPTAIGRYNCAERQEKKYSSNIDFPNISFKLT